MKRGVVIVAGWLAAATLGVACREHEGGYDAKPGPALSAAATTRILYPSAPGSFVDLVNGARHGVVAIRAGSPVKSGPAAMFPGTPETSADIALGTGFLIESNGTFVLTNDHIAAASTELRVVLPDRTEAAAKLIGRDVRLDLALLSIDVPRLQPLGLGNSNDLQVGEWLVVLGDPFGDELNAAVGIVSTTGREVAGSLVPGRAMGFRTFIQTDARIHRGNSGGPVLDTAGEVVGIAVATSDHVGELSFVIPINRVKEVLEPLRVSGQVARSWLGVLVNPVTAEQAKTLGMPKQAGALITEIKLGSPAARSGLRVGDVITKWGDTEVDHRSLPFVVAQTPPSRPINVAVWRSGAEVPIPVVTEKMPE